VWAVLSNIIGLEFDFDYAEFRLYGSLGILIKIYNENQKTLE